MQDTSQYSYTVHSIVLTLFLRRSISPSLSLSLFHPLNTVHTLVLSFSIDEHTADAVVQIHVYT